MLKALYLAHAILDTLCDFLAIVYVLAAVLTSFSLDFLLAALALSGLRKVLTLYGNLIVKRKLKAILDAL